MVHILIHIREQSFKVIKIGTSDGHDQGLAVAKHLEGRCADSIGRLCVRQLLDAFRVTKDNVSSRPSHLCLVYEPLGINLMQYVASQTYEGLSIEETRYFLFYIVHALDFLHTNGVVHTGTLANFMLDGHLD